MIDEGAVFIPGFQLGIRENEDGTFSPVILLKPCANEEEAEALIHKMVPLFERVLGADCLSRVQ